MSKSKMKLSDQIRAAVKGCGKTQTAVCDATGIDNGEMSNFLAGNRGLGLKNLDKLVAFLDLELKPRKKGR